jgi:four helix bundle protein
VSERPVVKGFEDLQIWRGAYDLALQVYDATAAFPLHADAELRAQLRRSASAIGAHIAGGFGRYSRVEYLRALHAARGSLMETRHFIHLADGLDYLSATEAERLVTAISRLNSQLYRTVTALRERAPTVAPREPERESSDLDN